MYKNIFLSYYMDDNTPLYGGYYGVKMQNLRSIENGDSANTKLLEFCNHSGTHIDFPNHFSIQGKVVEDYDANFWIFNSPYFIEIEAIDNQIIDLTIEQIHAIPQNVDFLILKTGFSKFRNEERYWKSNPGIAPELASKLKLRCPNLRLLGMDIISLTSFGDRPLGRISHNKFLIDNNILIVEDMFLDNLISQPKKIYCLPLLRKGLDGSPVTVIAEV
jgi:kynurenine formamidase